jgi:uncharacterized protein with von Willebrand factor type A (vWA) domain
MAPPKIFSRDSSLEMLRDQLDFADKKVAIIGNAQTIFSRQNGGVIDKNDAVVRINRGAVLDVACQGKRTTHVCLSLLMEAEELAAMHPTGKIIWMTPKRAELREDFIEQVRPLFYPRKMWWKLFYKLDQHRPSTGMMTIDLIFACAPKQISLYGFDFKKSKTFYDPVNYLGPHNWQAEKLLVEKLCATGIITIN